MTDFVEVNLEFTLETLSKEKTYIEQQLKRAIENNLILNCRNENQMREWRNDLAGHLALDAKKFQSRQDKNKKKKKKSKKQSQQQKHALEDLKEILKNILFCNEKYQNVKKNLIKICDKIDSSEMLYSILTPIIEQYLKELLKEDILNQTRLERCSQQVIAWLQEIKQNLLEIQQFGSIGFVMQSLNLFEKVLIYLLYNRPQFLVPYFLIQQIFVFWRNNTAKLPKDSQFIKTILDELPDLDEIEVVDRNQEGIMIKEQKKQKLVQCMKQIVVDDEQERIEKLIHYIQNMTFKQDRIKVNLDPLWLEQFLKKQKNNNISSNRSSK